MRRQLPSAPVATTGMIAAYGMVVASGSRTLGGVVLAAFGLTCIWIWLGRDGPRRTAQLTAAGLGAFALSHVLGLLIGAWPAVVVAAGAAGAAAWRWSDAVRPLASGGRRGGFRTDPG